MMQTVLLVETESERLRLMDSAARGEGRCILTSSGRDDALEKINREDLDLVVTGLALGSKGFDRFGLDVLRAAKAKDPEVPVILVSAYLTPREFDEALDSRAFDIIDRAASPVDSRKVLRLKINQALKLRELQIRALQHA